MTRRDIARMIFAFWAVTGLQAVMGLIANQPLDEWDHVHALIIAATVVLLEAIRGGGGR